MIKNHTRFLILLSLPFFLLGCTPSSNNNEAPEEKEDTNPDNPDVNPKEYLINPLYPLDNQTISLANEDVAEFAMNYTFASSSKYVKDYDHYDSNDYVALSWSVSEEANYYIVEFSEHSNLSDASFYLTNKTSFDVDGVYAGKTYYWKVNAYYESKIIQSRTFTLHTLAIPTTIYLESVGNLRDLGGIVTEDNKRIKNGLVFRGANADGVNEQDKDYMVNTLGIKTEIDLRNKNEGSRNKLGVENCFSISDNGGLYYNESPNGISYKSGQEALVKELRYFANRDNYPIFFHCAIGRDRTGSLALILLSLLGVSKKDICIDYELSMFAFVSSGEIRAGSAAVNDLLNNLFTIYNYIYGGFAGKTMKEKTEAFLLEIGLTQQEINNIREIMLEDR